MTTGVHINAGSISAMNCNRACAPRAGTRAAIPYGVMEDRQPIRNSIILYRPVLAHCVSLYFLSFILIMQVLTVMGHCYACVHTFTRLKKGKCALCGGAHCFRHDPRTRFACPCRFSLPESRPATPKYGNTM